MVKIYFNFIESNLEIPFSSIVTPYTVSATSIVPFICVIIKNCVSFGPNFPGQQDMCHQTDEFIDINNLMLSCKIYAKAIEELSSKKF